MFELIEKRQVAAAFSRAAATYNEAAGLQREVGNRLLDLLFKKSIESQSIKTWVDVGCGTGYFCEQLLKKLPAAQGIGLDLAEGMLNFSRLYCPDIDYVCADAESLPFISNSQDLVFSSLALQWCTHFNEVLSEVNRVLKPGGLFLFSSVAEGSLCELKQSWKAVDTANRVNQFRSFTSYQKLVSQSSLDVLDLYCHEHVYYYEKVQGLTRELKQLGANHIQNGRAKNLMNRQGLQRLLSAYENYRQPQGLPASWQVVYGVLQKKGEK